MLLLLLPASYYNTGSSGETLSLIWDQTENRKCDVIDNANNPYIGTKLESGHWSAHTEDKTVKGVDSLDAMTAGIYQVCFRRKDGVWKAVGLSVKIQSSLIGAVINSNDKTQRAAMIKKTCCQPGMPGQNVYI